MLALAISASGDLVRYTFEGTISSIEIYTLAGIEHSEEAFGHSLGGSVMYEFLVDTDLPATSPGESSGTSTFWDGENTHHPQWTAEYFYTDYVGGALIGNAIMGSLSQRRGSTTEFITTHSDQEIETSRTISLAAENDLSMLTVYNNLDSIGAWDVDTLIQGLESYFVKDEATGIHTGTVIYSNMRIASIEPLPASVPEPSTGLLLAGGLICLLGAARLRKPSRRDQK